MMNSEKMDLGLPVLLPAKKKQVVYDNELDSLESFFLAGEDQILRQFAQYEDAVSLPGFYTFIPGEGPLLLVAHVDTVRHQQMKPDELVYSKGVYRTAGKEPLGADDRAGVYAIHRLMDATAKPHILLTDGEESGGFGVRRFIEDKVLEPYLDGITLMLEFDRFGADEAVTYSGSLPQYIEDYLESFGWRTGYGSYTDIATLIDSYAIPGVNLSVGYYDQHTGSETLVRDVLEMTIKRALDMINDPPTEKHQQEARVYSKYGYGKRDNYGHYGSGGFMMDDFDDLRESAAVKDPKPYQVDIATTLDDVQWMLDAIGEECPCCFAQWYDCACGTIGEMLMDQLFDDELTVLLDHHPRLKDLDSPVADFLLRGYLK